MKYKMPNGFGSITKLKGKRRKPFCVRKTIGMKENGQQIMQYLGYYETYKEAMEALLFYNENGDTEDRVKEKTSLEAIYEALCQSKFTKAGKSIPSAYSSSYKRFKDFSEVCFKDITLSDLENVMDTLESPVVQRNCKTLLNQMYIYAIKHDIVDKNIATYLSIDKYVNGEIHKPFTMDEIKFLWEHREDWEAKLWLIYIYTGLRPSELRIMKNEDVHLSEQYMRGGIKNDYSKNRYIPIADCILPIVTSLFSDDELLIRTDTSTKGIPIAESTLAKYLQNYLLKSGIEHLLHDGRHTFSTMMDDAGVPTLIIQKIMGHAPHTLVEKTYIHKESKKYLEAVNKLPFFS